MGDRRRERASTQRITVRITDNGVPALSTTAAIEVTVREINQAPEIAPIPLRTINEGAKLTLVASAQDPDLPANRLSFQLGAGAPAGAKITPDGVFTWTLTSLQGPSTNRIPIIVTDDGSPNRSTTETAVIIVRDFSV